ncbi:MAG TPA: GntR family transcriptional regulator [Thermoleophilia bacterium]|nr:GntR family transcriptional regulator [Thermoleophilia bacterium]
MPEEPVKTGSAPRGSRAPVAGGAAPSPSRSGGPPRKRNPYEPAYAHIVNTVSDRIARGEYRSGDRLPSESQFCAEFSVSPMTLRRAVNMLVDRGLVITAQGRGTFVRPLDLGEATFKLQQLTSRWREASTEVRLVEASIVPAAERVAEILGLALGEKTVYLRRLFVEDGHPFMYHAEHVVYDARRPLVESQLQITSLEGVLKSAGGEGFARARLTIQAVNLDETIAGHLDRPPGTAAFCLEHVFESFDGVALSWGSFFFLSDEFQLVTYMGAEAGGGGS